MAQPFLRALAGDIEGTLRSHAFEGTDLAFRKRRGHVISCLVVQEHSSKTKCCVDLGVHLDFIPVVGGASAIQFEAMTVPHCEIRKRLTPEANLDDFWWGYSDADARAGIVTALETQGFPFFKAFESFPDYWLGVSLGDLRSGSYQAKLPGVTRVRAALLLARVHAFLGDWPRSHDLAAFGLEIVPAIATGPKKAFKELLAQRPA